jgi:hydroxymethylbilane synthase
MTDTIRLGTRGSRLALRQTDLAKAAMLAVQPDLVIETTVITTSGDWRPDQGETLLSQAAGGKGLFAKEIENALQSAQVDIGVHSAKDMPSFLPKGLRLTHFLKREDPRDAFLSRKYTSLEALPKGAIVGTSAMRRQAILLEKRPDLQIVPVRGNVPTRIDKLYQGQMDAIILAAAGLHRLGMEDEITAYLEPSFMLPASGQGVIALESRDDDTRFDAVLDAVADRDATWCVTAERAVLQVLDGSCRTPIGAYATVQNGRMRLDAMVARPDGQKLWRADGEAGMTSVPDALALGIAVGEKLRAICDPDVLAVA